jgi:hypothetical protein
VAALRLKLEHHLSNALRRLAVWYDARLDRLAEVVILAEDAAQVAVGEEDGARSVPPPEAVLFSEVREVAPDHGVSTGLTGGPAILQPIDAAVAWTDATLLQRRDGPLDPVSELLSAKAEVGWPEHVTNALLSLASRSDLY